ncbi:unnamed protein product [Durusdinium trenchii]|uniref:Uncharacterized protein n=1 Tax=Durusdinium trenchii TaxID=1381693 RepID=A0ABP0K6R5_9DINO
MMRKLTRHQGQEDFMVLTTLHRSEALGPEGSHGPDVLVPKSKDVKSEEHGAQALQEADVQSGMKQILEMMKSHTEAAPGSKELRDHGWTPVHEAALFGRSSCLQCLLEHGAKKDIQSHAGLANREPSAS